MKFNSPLISIEDFKSIINDENTIVFDASNGKGSKERYQKEHIHGAIYIDLETELSAIEKDPQNGGRHPLPSSKVFCETLSNKGILPTHHIIIYDDNNGGIAAARFWWMLKSVGHEKVQVLNGGYLLAKKHGLPIDSVVKELGKSTYPVSDWKLPTVNFQQVMVATENKPSVIIDVRAADRYEGVNEPIDKKAGHIPSAKNVHYFKNISEDGLFKSKNELIELYQAILMDKDEVIVHCGSGVTACHTILAMVSAGLPFPKLYVGSWSEWSRRL